MSAIKCRDRLVARAVLPPPPARPATGAGAYAVGPRRIVTALLVVCASGAAAVSAPPILRAMGPDKAPVTAESHGVRHWWPLPWERASVPAPGALVFVPACLALAWLRRGASPKSRRAAGDPRGFPPSVNLAGRGVPRRARRFFAWRA